MQSARILRVGFSSVAFEPLDTMNMVLVGDVDGATADALMAQMIEWSRPMPYALYLMNVVDVSSISAEARKILTSNGHRLPPRALAMFGGSFTTRVALDLMDRASWLLGSRNRYAKHWPDEKSARNWIAEMRTVLETNLLTHAR
jgi:hypothetical protein